MLREIDPNGAVLSGSIELESEMLRGRIYS